MVTLAEFVSHVANVGEIIGLMERAISHIQRGGKAEPVSRWSLNVIKQHVNGSELDSLIDGADSTETFASPTAENPRSWIESDWSMNLEQEFPSLEDMFFGNAA
jgi:hypothetical protein